MAGLSETASANRIHIAFFGLRNAGKSALVNAFCGQSVAIVSDTPGTTTDPVSKAMEILPLGPSLVTDTAGLDDEGELGKQRVEKSLKVLESADIAVWVSAGEKRENAEEKIKREFTARCEERKIMVLEFRRGDSVEELRRRIAAVKIEREPRLLEGLVQDVRQVVLVCPIDESAPQGRMILPQVQVLRECLDRHLTASVVQPEELADCLQSLNLAEDGGKVLVITDSQAFEGVKATIAAVGATEGRISLTSFSILFARQKGDLETMKRGLEVAKRLKDGDRVLIAEACTHHRQCQDIGTTKIPQALMKLSGARLEFEYASGNDFTVGDHALIVHCGGCMLTRRAMLARINQAKQSGKAMVNYGLILNAVAAEGRNACAS